MIAYWMLYAVAVGLPILLAAMLAAAVLRRHGRPERAVWASGLGLSMLLPVAALLRPGAGPAPGSAVSPEPGVIGLPEIVVLPGGDAGLEASQLLIALWIGASFALALRWAVAAVRLARLKGSWRTGTVEGIPVARTDDLGPAVAGVFRPRVLAPMWLDTLPAKQRALVLLHEQEHIRARDPLLLAAARLARVLAPWNPAVWLLSARLVRAIELDCDRRVLRRRPDVRTYGTTLLNVSSRDSNRLVAVAAFAESEAPLRSRILAMTTPPRAVSILGLLTATVLGVVLLIGAFEIPVPAVRISIEVDPAGAQPPVEPPRTVIPAEPEQEPAVERGRSVDEPPSVEETLTELRRRGGDANEPRRRTGGDVTVGPRTDDDAAVAAGPRFTPFTVAPSILNRDEVVRAMVQSYPALLRDAGIGGTVRVYFYIDETGVVRDTRIDQSSGHSALDEAALAVASVYRFSPALNRDARTPVWVSFPITFQVR